MPKNVKLSVAKGDKLPVSKGASLTAKGRAKYNKATGSNLQAPAPTSTSEKEAARKRYSVPQNSSSTANRSQRNKQ